MNKPKIYELWFSDYDGNSSWQFTHPNNKLQAEFKQDCQDVVKEFAADFVNSQDSWVGAYDLLKVIADNLNSRATFHLTKRLKIYHLEWVALAY